MNEDPVAPIPDKESPGSEPVVAKDTESPETQAVVSLKGFTARESELLRNFADPSSPGYLNGTKSAELAGYAGDSGSNQLSVQGSRTVKKARESGTLLAILAEKGCSLERAAERLAACLDAKRRRHYVTKSGQTIELPLEDDYREQRLATKLIFELYGALGPRRREPAAACTCHETRQAADQNPAPEEYRKAVAILNESDAVDRESLRDVLECDATADPEAREP